MVWTQMDFRKRLANSLRWYEVLLNEKDAAVRAALASGTETTPSLLQHFTDI